MKTLKVLSVLLMLSFCCISETNAQSWKELKKAFKEAKEKVSQNSTSKKSNDEITLIVSADGATKEEATKSALRSAIEQAYGTFVSANTAILNDDLVKDEIVTIASGNIKSYNELFCNTNNEKTIVSLEAIVSISNLINYAKSKGSEAEFAGATFAMNLKMKELNKKNEESALNNLLIQVKELFNNGFDYELAIGDPILSNNYKNGEEDMYELPLYVTASYNDNIKNAFGLIWNTLNSLSLNQYEVEEYKKHNINTGEFIFGYTLNNLKYGVELDIEGTYGVYKIPEVGMPIDKNEKYRIINYVSRLDFTLKGIRRQPSILKELEFLFEEGFVNFVINDNTGGKTFYEKEYNEVSKKYYYPIVDMGKKYGEEFKCEETKREVGLIIGINPKHTLKIVKTIPASELSKYNNFEVVRKQ